MMKIHGVAIRSVGGSAAQLVGNNQAIARWFRDSAAVGGASVRRVAVLTLFFLKLTGRAKIPIPHSVTREFRFTSGPPRTAS
jgi:hypothetical protein